MLISGFGIDPPPPLTHPHRNRINPILHGGGTDISSHFLKCSILVGGKDLICSPVLGSGIISNLKLNPFPQNHISKSKVFSSLTLLF